MSLWTEEHATCARIAAAAKYQMARGTLDFDDVHAEALLLAWKIVRDEPEIDLPLLTFKIKNHLHTWLGQRTGALYQDPAKIRFTHGQRSVEAMTEALGDSWWPTKAESDPEEATVAREAWEVVGRRIAAMSPRDQMIAMEPLWQEYPGRIDRPRWPLSRADLDRRMQVRRWLHQALAEHGYELVDGRLVAS